jgi:hypothetical protein
MVEPDVSPNAGLPFYISKDFTMAQITRSKQPQRPPRRKAKAADILPLTKENYVLLGVGVLIIIVGYIVMGEGSVKGFMPLVLAPILLILGYCVAIPLALLYRKREAKSPVPAEAKLSEPVSVTPPSRKTTEKR